jgi:hypothetical protein
MTAWNTGCFSKADDIFQFWDQVGPSAFVHPLDEAVFRRLGPKGHGFFPAGCPGNFMGPLKTASVVLLYMSAGLSPEYVALASSPKGRQYLCERRKGQQPLPDITMPGGSWWLERTKCFEVPASTIASNVAFLNISAYQSKTMQNPELLAALPSSRACIDWVQEKLFPEAEQGKKIVICLRAAKFWGLSPTGGTRGTLFVPPVTRSGHMQLGPLRQEIIEIVRRTLSFC